MHFFNVEFHKDFHLIVLINHEKKKDKEEEKMSTTSSSTTNTDASSAVVILFRIVISFVESPFHAELITTELVKEEDINKTISMSVQSIVFHCKHLKWSATAITVKHISLWWHKRYINNTAAGSNSSDATTNDSPLPSAPLFSSYGHVIASFNMKEQPISRFNFCRSPNGYYELSGRNPSRLFFALDDENPSLISKVSFSMNTRDFSRLIHQSKTIH